MSPGVIRPYTMSHDVTRPHMPLTPHTPHPTHTLQPESIVTKAARLVFFLCIALIMGLLFVYWYGWTLFGLLRVMIPVAVVSLCVGYFALRE